MKVFRVSGEIRKPNLKTPFAKDVLAEKRERAVEKVYAELGSKHRVKRFQIKITDVAEIPVEQVDDPLLKRIITGEGKVGE